MAIQFAELIPVQSHEGDGTFSVQSVELSELGSWTSPITLLHNFRVSGHPFGPHPHAGFSAVTCVFEDSKGSLRSRDSLGNDLVTGPGGIVWTQAGSGLIHEELPAKQGRELHGLQIFVNLSSKNKLMAPQVFRLEQSEVPEWRSDSGDRVRVLVGTFEGISSPLVPADPFTLLEVYLQHKISFSYQGGENALVYVLTGDVDVRADSRNREVANNQALPIYGNGGLISLEAVRPAHFFLLSGAANDEPVHMHGPFIMNDPSQIEAAILRYNTGGMGYLTPLSDG